MRKLLRIKIPVFSYALLIFLGISQNLWAAAPTAQVENGKKVTLAYKLTVEKTLLETADAKNPFIYVHGKNQIVPGLEKNLTGLKVGEKKIIHVTPEEAYGPLDPKARREIPKEKLPPELKPTVGAFVEARRQDGLSLLVKIVEVKDQTVVLDFNHPLAGKELEFQIEVLNIQ